MLAEGEKERRIEELQQEPSHAQGTRVKCEALCRLHTEMSAGRKVKY